MKKYLASMILIPIAFVACGKASIQISNEPDWNALKMSILMTSATNQNLGQFGEYVSNTGLTSSDINNYLDANGSLKPNPPENLAKIWQKLDSSHDAIIKIAKDSITFANKLGGRAEKIANFAKTTLPFENIVIQVDPSLPPGLTRVIIAGKTAILFVPPMAGQESFDSALLNAILQNSVSRKEYDTKSIEKVCQKYGASLSPREQVFADLAFSLSTWIDNPDMPTDLRAYTLKSSLKYGHIFSPQLGYGDMSVMENTKLEEIVDQAFADCSNPKYLPLLESLLNPRRLGIKVNETPQGLEINELSLSGPSEQAGLLPGDIIVEVDTQKITKVWELENLLYDKAANQYVIVKVSRDKTLSREKVTTFEDDPSNTSRLYLFYQVLVAPKNSLPKGVY
ncbi:MAG: PDZ domain-containing protein [Caldisericales bacterium]|nr:PDZ domain-containing protein [Caldisericia bacterium]NMD13772.1 PDZ domain-containing protein [Caldisericales bacterium]